MPTNSELFAVLARLNIAERSEIREHDHGGLTEVFWNEAGDGDEIAHGYFGDSSVVHVQVLINGEPVRLTFQGDRARALRHAGQCISVETEKGRGAAKE